MNDDNSQRIEAVLQTARRLTGMQEWLSVTVSPGDEVPLSQTIQLLRNLADQHHMNVSWSYFKPGVTPDDGPFITVNVYYRQDPSVARLMLCVHLPPIAYELCEAILGPGTEVDISWLRDFPGLW